MRSLVTKCNCYPSYDDDYRQVPKWRLFLLMKVGFSVSDFRRQYNATFPPCNFFEQSTCVAALENEYDEQDFAGMVIPSSKQLQSAKALVKPHKLTVYQHVLTVQFIKKERA